jgi:hypothetical protein
MSGFVDLGHQPPVGFPGGGELLLSFLGSVAQVEVFLLEGLDPAPVHRHGMRRTIMTTAPDPVPADQLGGLLGRSRVAAGDHRDRP